MLVLQFNTLIYILFTTCINCRSESPFSAIISVFAFVNIMNVVIPSINSAECWFPVCRSAIMLVLEISAI